MAPEQVEGREADKRSDIWALGAVLYEMATGQRPFDGHSPASIIGAILRDTPPAVSARRPLVPAALDHVVERCLEKDADERWQDAGDLRRELTWIAGAGSRLGAPDPRAQRGRRVAPWIWIAVASALAAAGLGIAALSAPRPGPATPSRMAFSIMPPDQARFGGSLALSPDDHRLAFVGLARDGPASLWIRPMDSTAAEELPGTEDAAYPFWSPRGDALGFLPMAS